ncbi:MAG: hypothetical protein GX601_01245, partial [Anaerolineales bacterium]|nr:hypothetical protein [Anaerolineales bacterium]
PEAARRLVERYPARAERQLAHYRWACRRGKARSPGWLVRAIFEDWELPPEVQRELDRDDPRRYIRGAAADFIQW